MAGNANHPIQEPEVQSPNREKIVKAGSVKHQAQESEGKKTRSRYKQEMISQVAGYICKYHHTFITKCKKRVYETNDNTTMI